VLILLITIASLILSLRPSGTMTTTAMHWFRKGLRIHDNPALIEALADCRYIYPVFCIDPHFACPDRVGVNRYSFLLECLHDLDQNLRTLGTRLYVIKGKPELEIPRFIRDHDVDLLTFERDTEPYATKRDSSIRDELVSSPSKGRKTVVVSSHCSHTIHDPEQYLSLCGGNIPRTYQSFIKLFEQASAPRIDLPPPTGDMVPDMSAADGCNSSYDVPALDEVGYAGFAPSRKYIGGETEALERLRRFVTAKERASWVRGFEKPSTSPNSIDPSTTVLSPYLKFGCLSVTKFYNELEKIVRGHEHSKPPVSLHGQLLWREFFYFSSYVTPYFDRMIGNPQCKQISWDRDAAIVRAWEMGQTGYPFIDAIMNQLRTEGWIHHLARHAVACFLTRGDLWQHWEEGVRVFDIYLLDDDWALNNANWQWLSASNFFYQYFRVYSPIAFGKKTDPTGEFIRKWVPQLATFPAKYIYDPWNAPLGIQRSSNCIIGTDYPLPIVDHDTASKTNMGKMKTAYQMQSSAAAEEVPRSTTAAKRRKADPVAPADGIEKKVNLTAFFKKSKS